MTKRERLIRNLIKKHVAEMSGRGYVSSQRMMFVIAALTLRLVSRKHFTCRELYDGLHELW